LKFQPQDQTEKERRKTHWSTWKRQFMWCKHI